MFLFTSPIDTRLWFDGAMHARGSDHYMVLVPLWELPGSETYAPDCTIYNFTLSMQRFIFGTCTSYAAHKAGFKVLSSLTTDTRMVLCEPNTDVIAMLWQPAPKSPIHAQGIVEKNLYWRNVYNKHMEKPAVNECQDFSATPISSIRIPVYLMMLIPADLISTEMCRWLAAKARCGLECLYSPADIFSCALDKDMSYYSMARAAAAQNLGFDFALRRPK